MPLSPSLSSQHRAAIDHHGIYLVPRTGKADAQTLGSNFVYRIVAVGAALFLAITVC